MQDGPNPDTPWRAPVPVARLDTRKPRPISLSPDAETRAALAKYLGIVGIRKLALDGTLSPFGRKDWKFEGKLGATVVQECVVTLEPVTTRIEEQVSRLFAKDIAPAEPGSETEMPEDDTVELLEDEIDPGQIMAEALALALPLYPRAPGAELSDAQFSGPGIAPMTDEDARPFAALKGLKEQLDQKKN